MSKKDFLQKYTDETGNRPMIMVTVLVIALIAMIIVIFFAVKGMSTQTVSSGISEDESNNSETHGGNSETTSDQSGIYPTVPTRASYIPIMSVDTDIIYGVGAKAAIIVDASDLRVLASYHSDEKIYPASMTKVMTVIVAAEHLKNLTDTVTVTRKDHEYIYSFDASGVGFKIGERLTVKDMLYAITVESDCLASYMLAKYVAGSEEAFVELMNDKAQELGLTGTHFANSTGLHDDENYTTVRDMAAIMAYALDSKTCLELLSAEQYKMYSIMYESNITMYSTLFVDKFEKLFSNLDHSFKAGGNTYTVVAGKTGYTVEAGQCLVSYTECSDGRKYIVVTAGSSGTRSTVDDLMTILKEYSH